VTRTVGVKSSAAKQAAAPAKPDRPSGARARRSAGDFRRRIAGEEDRGSRADGRSAPRLQAPRPTCRAAPCRCAVDQRARREARRVVVANIVATRAHHGRRAGTPARAQAAVPARRPVA
jgi:hypothetical protein